MTNRIGLSTRESGEARDCFAGSLQFWRCCWCGSWPFRSARRTRWRTTLSQWNQFDVAIELLSDGRLSVTETQVIDFNDGPFTAGSRNIPLGKVDGISNVQVSEVTGGTKTPYTQVSSFSREPETYSVIADIFRAPDQLGLSPNHRHHSHVRDHVSGRGRGPKLSE